MKRKLFMFVLTFVMTFSAVIGVIMVNAVDTTSVQVANPIARYEFKDSSNLGKDSTGKFNLLAEGAVVSGANMAAKRGAYFDGTSKLFATKDSSGRDFSDYLYDFTVSFWFYAPLTTDQSGYHSVLSTGLYGNNNGICFKNTYQGYHNVFAISNNGVYYGDVGAYWKKVDAWQHIVYSVSNTTKTASFYFDGELIASNPNLIVTMENLDDVFSLGAGSYNSGTNSNFNGYIDDVEIYDFAVNATNVTSLKTQKDILQSEVPLDIVSIDSATEATASVGESALDLAVKDALKGKSITVTNSNGTNNTTTKVIWGNVDRSNVGYALVKGITFINGVSNYKNSIVGKVELAPNIYALPLIWYKFNDATNFGKDSMGNFNLSTFGTVAAGSEGGVSFNGTNGLYTPQLRGGLDVIDNIPEITISFRAKRTDGALTPQRIISHGYNGSDTGMAIVVDDRVRFPVENSSGSNAYWDNSVVKGNLNSWNTYSLVVSKTTGTMYLNGELLANFSAKDQTELKTMSEYFAFTLGGSFHIGDNAISQGFTGDIDDFRIYDYALSASEVMSIHLDKANDEKGIIISNEKATIASYVLVDKNNVEIKEITKESTDKINDLFIKASTSQDKVQNDDYTKYYGTLNLKSNKNTSGVAKVLWYAMKNDKLYGQIVQSDFYNTTSIVVNLAVKCSITYKLNGGVNSSANLESYSMNTSVTLENPIKTGSIFVGWVVDNVLIKPSSAFTINSNKTVEAIFINMSTVGAGVRLSEPTGLRFTNEISTSDYNALKGLVGESKISLGTLLMPTTILGANELTISSANVLNITKTIWAKELAETKQFNAVLLNIPETKYKTEITARAYITITYSDGTQATYYSASISRSISSVAKLAYDSGVYTEAENALLLKYIGGTK